MNQKQLNIILMTFTILIVVMGCSSTENSSHKGHNTQSSEADVNQPEQNKDQDEIYQSEEKDIQDKMKVDGFTSEMPNVYEITATAELREEEDADRIVYEVFINKPKIEMKHITLSFSLHPKMFDKLNTSNVFMSTAMFDQSTSLQPGEEPYGTSLARGFVMNKNLIEQDMKNIYDQIFVKISYVTKEEQVEEYFQLQAKISSQLEKYVNDQLGSVNNFV
ncbi:hypothetical protein [Marinicrinis sediminis]|uniref:Uncharacterized protein n=1 Tax=Marinicrinis sediminis TaxID=1652465 RepID=A0ABW5R7L7_9BACL